MGTSRYLRVRITGFVLGRTAWSVGKYLDFVFWNRASRLVVRPGMCRPDFSPFSTCVVQESGSSGVWTVEVVG